MSDDELSPRLAIEAQYARLNEAVRNKDLDAFCALHAPDYRDLRVTGQERGLAEVAAEWRGDLADLIEPRLQTEVIGLDLDGDKATVKVRSTRTSVSLGFASRRLGNRIE